MMQKTKSKKLLIMAGGTGGHVFPGLAVAHILLAEGWDVRWLGTADRMEATLVPKHGVSIDFIQIAGLRGKGLSALIIAPFTIIRAVLQAKKVINAFKPDAVLGMGGYVSGPGGIAAKLSGIPIIIHEQNSVAGLTNKWLARFSTCVLQAFPGALNNAIVVGNPVRQEVTNLPHPSMRLKDRKGRIHVLIVGGSQGSQILNNVMPLVFKQLPKKIVVWHQTGKGARESVIKVYGEANLYESKVAEFINNMAEAYAWADVVVCRSGALTVSEVAAAGVPAIFVPFKHKDRQQYFNAKPLEDAGAAVIIEQVDFTAVKVAALLLSWDRATLLNMAIKASKFAVIDSAERVALIINKVTN